MLNAQNSTAQQDCVQPTLPIHQRHHLRRMQTIKNTPINQSFVEDEVHGIIEIPFHIGEIINHSIFQRLKKIKQLGLLSAIFPEATHTRYEHCIGTYKSAQDHLNALRHNSNGEHEMPEWCRQSVEIAALLHDIGHGPFSHNWEQVCGKSFNHEENGLMCVDKIFGDMKNASLRSLRDDNNGRGVQLIKALILGKRELLSYPIKGQGYIFDIIHNRRCGLDVDKWDYLRRDNKRLNLLTDEEMKFDEIFQMSHISRDGQHIEYRYDDYHLIYKLYVARWRLHIGAYKLPKALAIGKLFGKIVRRSKPELLYIKSGGDDWLDLNDEHILQLIKSDPLIDYLFCPERFLETAPCEGQNANCLCINQQKEGPGVDMFPDESYSLYGDWSKKLNIIRITKPTAITACYKLI